MPSPRHPTLSRRTFLRVATTATSILPFATSANPAPLRAAVIGHTGRGDYGHGLDLIFAQRPGIETVAVADPDPAGRAQAARRIGTLRAYADHRELLEREKPDLVSLAMRHADQHHAIALDCLRAGAHLYCEKPFTTCPAESDELLALARQHRLKIAVAHNMRAMPATSNLHRYLANGQLGTLMEMRAYGKQDHRAGGEDMMVLGTHLFDLMRLFAGSPLRCSARVLQHHREINRADARLVKDNVGPVAGNQVFATFAFPDGVHATFTSAAPLRETVGQWGLELHGSRGIARLNCDLEPHAFLRQLQAWSRDGRNDGWQPLDSPASPNPPTPQNNAVSDWLQAIAEDREPLCSGAHAAWAVEMVMAVYHASLTHQSIPFPLASRQHPLAHPPLDPAPQAER